MATYVNFYTISFEDSQGNPTTRNLIEFFKKIEFLANQDIDKIYRKVNGSQYRVSSYYWPNIGEHFVIIPIGKVKSGTPYVETADRKNLKELNQRVYDVNILAYDCTYKTMLLTNHQSAPNSKEIEDYFNTYLDPDDPIRIRIRPIKYNTGIENIRNAARVRSVIFDLNLTAGMANMFQTQNNPDRTLADYFRGLVHGARENMMGNSMKLEIGLGHAKKEMSLDKDTLLDLISTLNIDSHTINEIEVRYYNGEREKIDKARIKRTEMILSHKFSLSGSKVGAEYLKQHLQEPYSEKYGKFAPHVRNYFLQETEADDDYQFIAQWNGEVIVN